MTTETTPAGPAAMEGDGGYNRRSAVQAAGASPAVPLLEQAAREVALPGADAPIVIADYGSSEGRNSLAPLAAALQVLRARTDPSREISVVHTDLPGNDFNALFRLLASDPASYMRHDQRVFASAVGRSFYEQVLPAASVTLGWSGWAVQWLSRTPARIPDQVQIAYSRDEPARAAFARQAADDWETFLTHRATELRPGARLVILTMARTDAGDFGYRPLLEAMYGSLRAQVAEGLIGEDEAARMAIPTVGRTRAEFSAPFSTGRFAGLSLHAIDLFEGKDQLWHAFARDGDALAYGARWAAFSAASVLPTLAQNLDVGGQDSRAARFVARMEADMASRLAAAPEPMLIPLAALVIARDVDQA